MKWLILGLGILVNASASILIKVSSMPPRSLPSIQNGVPTGFANWPLWAGVFAYGLAFLTYVYSLSLFPASIAHPVITAGAIAVVATVAGTVLGENLSPLTIIGIAVVIAGVIMIALGGRPITPPV